MIDGAFAEYVSIRAGSCHHLPDSVSFREAALGEPLAVAVRAVVEQTSIHAGDLVLISGPGCVGLLTMQMAKLEGATVIMAGLAKDARRLACAKQLGADAIVSVSNEDLVSVVREMSGGEGADVVYECAGAARSLDLCWQAVRKEGTLVPLGIYPGPIETDFNVTTMKELKVIGCYGYRWTSWGRAVRLMAEKKVRTEELISHEFPLSNFDDAFRAAEDGSAIKVVFIPQISLAAQPQPVQ
jgi:L-iditol 2-dehydrogenase